MFEGLDSAQAKKLGAGRPYSRDELHVRPHPRRRRLMHVSTIALPSREFKYRS